LTYYWEYKTLTGSNDIENRLNALGDQGWELVSCYVGADSIPTYILKKPGLPPSMRMRKRCGVKNACHPHAKKTIRAEDLMTDEEVMENFLKCPDQEIGGSWAKISGPCDQVKSPEQKTFAYGHHAHDTFTSKPSGCGSQDKISGFHSTKAQCPRCYATERGAEAGFAEAYEIITNLRNRMDEQKGKHEAEIKELYAKAEETIQFLKDRHEAEILSKGKSEEK
jgi:hypothetical protein